MCLREQLETALLIISFWAFIKSLYRHFYQEGKGNTLGQEQKTKMIYQEAGVLETGSRADEHWKVSHGKEHSSKGQSVELVNRFQNTGLDVFGANMY